MVPNPKVSPKAKEANLKVVAGLPVAAANHEVNLEAGATSAAPTTAEEDSLAKPGKSKTNNNSHRPPTNLNKVKDASPRSTTTNIGPTMRMKVKTRPSIASDSPPSPPTPTRAFQHHL